MTLDDQINGLFDGEPAIMIAIETVDDALRKIHKRQLLPAHEVENWLLDVRQVLAVYSIGFRSCAWTGREPPLALVGGLFRLGA